MILKSEIKYFKAIKKIVIDNDLIILLILADNRKHLRFE